MFSERLDTKPVRLWIICCNTETNLSVDCVIYLDPFFDAHCCHMGTAIKYPVPERVKPSFVIFDIRAL